MLKTAVLVVASLFSVQSLSTELKPYRCSTESSVGAKTTKGKIEAVAFSDREEYRIKPGGDWYYDLAADNQFGDIFLGPVERAEEKSDLGVYFLRRVSNDPNALASWSVCRANEMPASLGGPYELVFCDESAFNGLGEFRFNGDTGRFTSVQFGDWHGTKPGDKPKTDSWFNFGVCTPYYD